MNRNIVWNRDLVEESLRFLNPRQADFLKGLTEVLNRYHGWDKPKEYYDIVCGEWILHFSHFLYGAYLEAKYEPDAEKESLPFFSFSDHVDYVGVSGSNRLFFNQVKGLIARFLDEKVIKKEVAENQSLVVVSNRSQLRGLPGIKQKAKQSFQAAISNKYAPLLIFQPYVKCEKKEWFSALFKWRDWARHNDLQYNVSVNARIDWEWRTRELNAGCGSRFEDIFRALAPLYIPVAYLEALQRYRNIANELRFNQPKAVYTANGLHGNFLFKTLMADWHSDGTILLNHQHGGGYGLDKIHAVEEYESRLSDRFFTLGWRGVDSNQVPLPGAIAKSCNRPGKGRDRKRILLVTVMYPSQVYRIHFQPMPGTIELLIAQTVDFARAMKNVPEFSVRMYPNDYGWGLKEKMLKCDPNLSFDNNSVSSLVSYWSSSLVIHNYLGTSWLETLSLNIPTICFYDESTYSFRESAQALISELESVGILHKNSLDAAQFAKSVIADPMSWWNDSSVQQVRRRFVEKYANFSSDWEVLWAEELNKWI